MTACAFVGAGSIIACDRDGVGNSRLLISQDGGYSWSLSSTQFATSHFLRTPGEGLVATEGLLIEKSTTNGASWLPLFDGDSLWYPTITFAEAIDSNGHLCVADNHFGPIIPTIYRIDTITI
ncbi:MAG TPA: hypothetical protein VFX22_00020, partial [Candidatus Kapabacteria bacterium]|nr:hypothetical protein [Candidatus Kapabacteria bacterium]